MNNMGIIQNNIKKREFAFRSFLENRIGPLNNSVHSVVSTSKNLSVVRNKLISLLDLKKNVGLYVTNSRVYLLPKVLKDLNTSQLTIIGYDLNEKNKNLLEENKIHFLLNQQPEWQGYNAAKGIFKFLTEGDSGALHLTIPVEIIVKENL